MEILVLSRSPVPMGNASSSYIWNTVRTMAESGHRVTVVGCNRGLASDFSNIGEYYGVKFDNFNANTSNKLKIWLFDRFWGKYAIKKIRQYHPEFVFLYGGMVSYAKKISKYCRENAIKYGAFECEWFTEDSFEDNANERLVKDICGLNPYNAEHSDCAILISSLLCDYYRNHNVPSVWIPNLVDFSEEKWNFDKCYQEGQKLKIAYAGVPGVGKDELRPVIEAIDSLTENEKSRIELHLWGPSAETLSIHMGEKKDILDKLDNILFLHGRVKQSDLPMLINKCNFTILIRKPSLRANAGFSTKMVESFCAGVPIIANLTGDIGRYLVDGVNGVVVKNSSSEACVEAIRKALYSLHCNIEMKEAALETAKLNFDYRNKVEDMKQFLSSIS